LVAAFVKDKRHGKKYDNCPERDLHYLSREPEKPRLPLSYYTYKSNKINKKTSKYLICEKNHGWK